MCLALLPAIGLAGAIGAGVGAQSYQEGKSTSMAQRRNARVQQAAQEELMRQQQEANRQPGVRTRYAFTQSARRRLALTKGGTLLTGTFGGGQGAGKTLLGQ